MSNKQRGDITIKGPEGKEYTLCLTLGAIAAIEDDLNLQSLTEIDTVMQQASMKSLNKILKALAAGGGNPINDDDLMAWPADFRALMVAVKETFKAAGFSDDDEEEGDTSGNVKSAEPLGNSG